MLYVFLTGGYKKLANIRRTPVEDPILDRIECALKAQKKTKKELLRYLGLQETNFTNWKYKNSKAYMKHIDKIALFLGVTTNYLLHGNTSSEESMNLTDDERKLISKYRLLDAHKRDTIMDLVLMIG